MCVYIHIEPVLIICGFCICEFPYSLKFICNLKINPCSAFMVSFRHVQSGKKFESCSQLRLNKATLCSLVSAPTVHKCPVPGLLSAPFSTFLYFLLVISLFKRAPKHSADASVYAPMRKEAVMGIMEKICILDKLCSGMNYSVVGCDLMLTNQQYILHKASLSRNACKIRLYIKNQLMETLVIGSSQEPNPVFPQRAMV